MKESEASQALAAIRSTRSQMARRAHWSFGRHAAFGLVMGGLVASYALPAPWPILGVMLCMAATALIVARDRSRDGFFVSGYRRGKTLRLSILIGLVTLAALAGAIALRTAYGLLWAPVAIGAAVALGCTIGSMVWERVYRRELGEVRDGD